MSKAQSAFTRNEGFIDAQQQARLASSVVAIAGVGGVGGRVATELARLGVGTLRIADPDTFTVTNLNRQEGAYHSTLGRNKAEVIAEICRDINPKISINVEEQGVTAGNLAGFVEGADIVIEATDFSLPHLGVMIAREARQHDIPLCMGVEVGFGANFMWFAPRGYSYEHYLGLPPDVALEALESGRIKVDFRRWLPHVPSYGRLDVLKGVATGQIEAPAIAPAVDICAALMSTQIVGLLCGTTTLPPAPAVFHFDAKEHRSRLIRHTTLHHYVSLMRMIANNRSHS